jgi:hypothetical protein
MQVFHRNPARRVLYSWTTPDQVRELRAGRNLLWKGPASGNLSAFDAKLWRLYNSDRIARMFFNPPFLLQRFAWPHPFATRIGGDVASYGDELLRITLKEEALLAAFYPMNEPPERWTFHDMAGKPVPEAEALRRASQIAAVYHVHLTDGSGPTFREYVICNEAMIASWSVATDEISKQFQQEQRAIALWRRALDESRPTMSPEALLAWKNSLVHTSWKEPPARWTLESMFESTLAFATEHHAPDAHRVDELLKALRSVSIQGEPLTRSPSLQPPRVVMAGPLPASPPKKVCYRGTMMRTECYFKDPNAFPCRDQQGRVTPCRE